MQLSRKVCEGAIALPKYSPSQFLILLIGTNKENCKRIFQRILDNFAMEHRTWKNYLKYYVSSVADIKSDSSQLKIAGNEFHWK